jgi:hypothetical protein
MEKYLIKNPLSIVAIFASIVEVAASVVTTQLSEQNQTILIWFIILFPTLLLLVFFLTLNLKHHVLYAPEDFANSSPLLVDYFFGKSFHSEKEIPQTATEQIELKTSNISEVTLISGLSDLTSDGLTEMEKTLLKYDQELADYFLRIFNFKKIEEVRTGLFNLHFMYVLITINGVYVAENKLRQHLFLIATQLNTCYDDFPRGVAYGIVVGAGRSSTEGSAISIGNYIEEKVRSCIA